MRLPNCIGFLKPKLVQSQPLRFLKASQRIPHKPDPPRLRKTLATRLTMAHVTHLGMISFSSSNAILLHLLLLSPNGVSRAFSVKTNVSRGLLCAGPSRGLPCKNQRKSWPSRGLPSKNQCTVRLPRNEAGNPGVLRPCFWDLVPPLGAVCFIDTKGTNSLATCMFLSFFALWC